MNKSVLDKTLKYLQFRLKKRETEPYQYFDANNIARERTIASKEIAYSLYGLALAGRQDPVAMSYYRANRPLLAEDSKFLLACTQSLLGNQRAFRELLPTQFGSQRPTHRALDGSFYSLIRDEGLVLNALVSTDPKQPANPRHRPPAQPPNEGSRLAQHPGARLRPAGPRQNSPPKPPAAPPPPHCISTANQPAISTVKTSPCATWPTAP